MELLEAVDKRHTVRRFLDRPIEKEVLEKLIARIEKNNEELNLKMTLKTESDEAFSAIWKLTLARSVHNYIILSGDGDCEERLGYASSDLMLYGQTLGLNTWWIGGSFSKTRTNRMAEGDNTPGVLVIGYGENQGRDHRSKKFAEVCRYDGQMPQWFINGVNAALKAPTAVNRQAFMLEGKDDKVSISYAPGPLSKADRGIIRHHFEIGAGRENFSWTNEML